MTLSLLVAVSQNGVIGRDNQLPWHLSADLKRFKSLTMGHHLVMGRKTFDSIGRPLPGRTTVVLTRSENVENPEVITVHSIDAALAAVAGDPEPFIVGGAEIYRQFLDQVERLYVTLVHARVEGGTAFFPTIDETRWQCLSSEHHAADEKNDLPFSFLVFEKR